MRFLVVLEQTAAGFAVQVPDLAIVTIGPDIEEAKRAACEAIRINLDAYRDAGQELPAFESPAKHLDNPDFRDLLFTYVEAPGPQGQIAA
jgi:predicted RNase H-like HicB family nuclease